MKILVFTEHIPYHRTNGLAMKLRNFIDSVCEEHQIDLFYVSTAPAGAEALAWIGGRGNLQLVKQVVLDSGLKAQVSAWFGLLSRRPLGVARGKSPAVLAGIRETLASARYDVCFVEMLNLSAAYPALDRIPTLLSLNDSPSRVFFQRGMGAEPLMRRLFFKLYGRLYLSYERNILRRFDAVHVVSPEERAWLERKGVDADIRVVPITLAPHYLSVECDSRVKSTSPCIFWNGNAEFVNIRVGLTRFITGAFPAVVAAVPGVWLRVLGRGVEKLRAPYWGDRIVADDFADDYVSELDRADIAVFTDIVGTGQKNRLIQAMARRLPCVCSPAVVEGIGGEEGQHFLVCRSPSDFSESCIRLLNDRSFADRIARAGQELVERGFSFSKGAEMWGALLSEVVGSRESSKPRLSPSVRTDNNAGVR